MRVKLALIALAALAATPASAMNVSEFLTRADALEKQGITALFSADYKILKQEVKSAGEALRRDQQTARAAGRKPLACLPDKAPVTSTELLAYFRAIPPNRRNVSVATAFTGMMKQKYPCPA